MFRTPKTDTDTYISHNMSVSDSLRHIYNPFTYENKYASMSMIDLHLCFATVHSPPSCSVATVCHCAGEVT